jgi:hypothetical protein
MSASCASLQMLRRATGRVQSLVLACILRIICRGRRAHAWSATVLWYMMTLVELSREHRTLLVVSLRWRLSKAWIGRIRESISDRSQVEIVWSPVLNMLLRGKRLHWRVAGLCCWHWCGWSSPNLAFIEGVLTWPLPRRLVSHIDFVYCWQWTPEL